MNKFSEDMDLDDVTDFSAPTTGTPRLISFLNSTLQDPNFDPEDGLYQAVLDLGYTEWQKDGRESQWDFGDMLDWVEENFGSDATLITMLGKFNQQVGNGGIVQWLDNGYASQGKRGRFAPSGISPNMNLGLLDRMLDLLSMSPLSGKYALSDEVSDILESIKGVIADAGEDCYSCRNHRYIDCEDCDGTGVIEDDGENETDCLSCGGEGEVPCGDCNAEGQLESDASHGDINYKSFEWLDSKYEEIGENWTKQIEEWLGDLVRGPKGNTLSRTQAIKATESILSVLDKILES